MVLNGFTEELNNRLGWNLEPTRDFSLNQLPIDMDGIKMAMASGTMAYLLREGAFMVKRKR